MSQKRFMLSFYVKFGLKKVRFRKVTSGNLKTGKFPVSLPISSGVICDEIASKSSNLK